MLIDLPPAWLIVINILAWLVIHLGVAWAGTRLPARWFRPGDWWYRERAWERGGRFYERAAGIRRWKDRLPDGAALFAGGFRKASLRAVTPEYLERFARETCRGEAVHAVVLLGAGLFFLWNPPWAGWVMVAYALLANLPCMLAQRYNRLRLRRLRERRAGRG
jgi:glycosyl-4,4'-diaponeurosporenoate acyltransferase